MIYRQVQEQWEEKKSELKQYTKIILSEYKPM